MRWVLLAVLAKAALAQAQMGSVTGKTVDPGMMFVPWPSVGIIASTNSFPGTIADGDKTGAFRLKGLPAGDYILAAKVHGFREIVRFVTVEAAKETNLGTVLLPFGSCDDPGVMCDTVEAQGAKKVPASIPILSLCEALTKRDVYFSRQVIVVGRLSETGRETTLTADCAFSLATGPFAWPTSIAVSGAAGARLPALPTGFKWDEIALDKVRRSLPGAKLSAIFGRFESPAGLVTLDCPRRVNCSLGMTLLTIPPALLIQDAVKTSRYLE